MCEDAWHVINPAVKEQMHAAGVSLVTALCSDPQVSVHRAAAALHLIWLARSRCAMHDTVTLSQENYVGMTALSFS